MTAPVDPAFRLSTYDFGLDPERIAQYPAKTREASRLEVLHRGGPGGRSRIEHRSFPDVVQYFLPGDLLVLNDSRVMPARIKTRKADSGGLIEVLLIRPVSAAAVRWEALIRGSVSPGRVLRAGAELEVVPVESLSDGRWSVELRFEGSLREILEKAGSVPLPPYIRRESGEEDRERYQTVYAKPPEAEPLTGSVAAPTAGLHFTTGLLDKIRTQGARTAFLTLHIGPGTFRPVRSEDIREHRMDPEYFEIPEETVRLIEETRIRGGRVIAVGTTVARTLEAATAEDGTLRRSGAADLFIHPEDGPGYRFSRVAGLITNFHMPKSTLFMLVCAFAGTETMKEAYAEAVRLRYRFLSFGDAMLIL